MTTRDRLLGLVGIVLGGLLAAAISSRLGVTLGLLVLALFLRRSLRMPRVMLGFFVVVVAAYVGSLPVIEPVDHAPERFHSETLTVIGIVVLKDEILIQAEGQRRKHVLNVANAPGRAQTLKKLRPGDAVRAWFVEENGYLWQLTRGEEFLVRIDDRSREKQSEVVAILLYPSIGLGIVGLLLIFL